MDGEGVGDPLLLAASDALQVHRMPLAAQAAPAAALDQQAPALERRRHRHQQVVRRLDQRPVVIVERRQLALHHLLPGATDFK